ncbi:MAG: peptidoglycan-binding domain-containing protein [Syntrophomonas sp.]
MEEGKLKKGNFFFLVFLLAAAVVLGSTVGLISNINYIVHKTEMSKEKPTSSKAEEETIAEPTNNSPETAPQADYASNNLESSPPPAQSASPVADPNQIDIGNDERQLLKEMLYNLGMKETDDFNAFVRAFQNKNSLQATGNIDYSTLNAIIQQSTMLEVSKSLNEGTNT